MKAAGRRIRSARICWSAKCLPTHFASSQSAAGKPVHCESVQCDTKFVLQITDRKSAERIDHAGNLQETILPEQEKPIECWQTGKTKQCFQLKA